MTRQGMDIQEMEDWQKEFGRRLVEDLGLQGTHPMLLQPNSEHHKALQLAQHGRLVRTEALAQALYAIQWASGMFFDLFICKSGMKLPARPTWLQPSLDAWAQELGPVRTMLSFGSKVVVVDLTLEQSELLTWLWWSDHEVQGRWKPKPNKVQIYPGGWVHNLKHRGYLWQNRQRIKEKLWR